MFCLGFNPVTHFLEWIINLLQLLIDVLVIKSLINSYESKSSIPNLHFMLDSAPDSDILSVNSLTKSAFFIKQLQNTHDRPLYLIDIRNLS